MAGAATREPRTGRAERLLGERRAREVEIFLGGGGGRGEEKEMERPGALNGGVGCTPGGFIASERRAGREGTGSVGRFVSGQAQMGGDVAGVGPARDAGGWGLMSGLR
jgi:hypothetical protein